jgi:hypothetical protein
MRFAPGDAAMFPPCGTIAQPPVLGQVAAPLDFNSAYVSYGSNNRRFTSMIFVANGYSTSCAVVAQQTKRATTLDRPFSQARTAFRYSLGWFAFASWIFFRMPSRL